MKVKKLVRLERRLTVGFRSNGCCQHDDAAKSELMALCR